ncbi:MAG: glycosyltransferase family 4 protein [Actinomycetota bacterium]
MTDRRPLRLLAINEGIGGHDTVHLHLDVALSARDDIDHRIVRAPDAGPIRRLLGAPIPGLDRLDLDLQPIRAQLAAAAALRRRLRAAVEWADVVHLYTQTAGYLSADLLAARPLVVTTDSAASLNAYRLPYRTPTRFTALHASVGTRLERRVLDVADVVVANSRWVADRLAADHDLDDDVLRVQPIGIADPGQDGPAPGIESDRPTVVFVGRQWRRKGGDLLLDAWERDLHAHADLVMVTPEPVPNAPAVSVVGDITPGDPRLTSLLRSAAAFALPSTIDQAPNAVLEAMAAGLACVVVGQGGAAEMVVDGVTGRHTEPTVESVTAAMHDVLDERARLRQWGAAARRRFVTEFSTDVTLPRLIDACHLAVDRHRPSGAGRSV